MSFRYLSLSKGHIRKIGTFISEYSYYLFKK